MAAFVLLAYWFVKSSSLLKAGTQFSISEFFAKIISFASAFAAIAAAFFAFKSTRSVEKTSEGQLYMQIMERYSSEKMLQALKLLGDKKKEHESDLQAFIENWWIVKQQAEKKKDADLSFQEKEALRIEEARHRIKYFYRDLMQLCQGNYFSRELAKRACNTGGRYIFKELVLLMELKVNSHRYENEFYPFNELFEELEKENKQL